MKNPEVGQKVFVSTIGNLARNGVETHHAEVVKVGRKYFVVKLDGRLRDISCYLNSWVQNNGEYSSYYQVWESERAYLESKKAEQLNQAINKFFNAFGKHSLSLKQLEQIAEIIGVKL